MATFNGELYIKEQLNSILVQLRPYDEVIISDDGSTDNTISIINSINDPRVRLFKNSFKNVILNFEFTLKKATGEIIFLSDQDDVWFSDKVKKSLDLLNRYDLIFTNLSLFKDDLAKSKPLYDTSRNFQGIQRNFIKNHCVGATMAFKSNILKYVLPFPKGIEMHDMWIFFISSFFVKTKYYNKPLIYYRRHGANVSNTGERTSNSIFKILRIRINWIYNLTKRIFKILFSNTN